MNVYKDLDAMTQVALHNAKDHRCNYNVILMNPDENGEFNMDYSTYEFVADSYFEKERPNAKLLFTTGELLLQEQVDKTEAVEYYKSISSQFDPEPFMIHNTYKEKYMDFAEQHANYGSLRSSQPPYVREVRKIGNNELCPCDSGKKYKKCCK